MKIILTDKAPIPGGHYSQAIQSGGFLFVSGQLPLDPATGKFLPLPIEAQARRALENLLNVVTAAGAASTDVVKVTVFIADMAYWPAVNKVYAEIFGPHRPARAVVPCGPLHYGAGIEIDAIAVCRD